MRAVLGVPSQVTIVWSTGEKIYANVATVVGIPKGLEMPAAVNASVVYDRDQHDQAVFNALPQWMRDKIIGAKSDAYAASAESTLDFDDDVPF